MKSGLTTAVIVVSALGGMAWLAADARLDDRALEDADAHAHGSKAVGDPLTGGSAVPCAVPLAWRVARVDPEFGITAEEARAAVQAAAELWERAAVVSLFVHDPRDGFPVRLIHDERQAAAVERHRAETELRIADQRLSNRRASIDRLASEHRRDADELDSGARALQGRIAGHHQAVRDWNSRGGAQPDTVRALNALGVSLDAEAAELERWGRHLEAAARRIRDQQRQFDDEIDAHNRRVARIGDAFPPGSVQSGVYREAVHVEGGRVASVSREVRVFRFDDSDDLIRIIAHELGHALGLGHTDAPGALMSEEYGRDARSVAPLIGIRDVRLFRERCPDL